MICTAHCHLQNSIAISYQRKERNLEAQYQEANALNRTSDNPYSNLAEKKAAIAR